jgi:hypothetical protein
MALNSGKMRKSILDIGGTVLKWLFGVSTQQDLVELSRDMDNMGQHQQQIVHLLDKQATIVNETLQCSPLRTLQLLAIGIFEVPPGCTARTEDWIFPASLEGQTEAKISSMAAPYLISFPSNRSFHQNAAVGESGVGCDTKKVTPSVTSYIFLNI